MERASEVVPKVICPGCLVLMVVVGTESDANSLRKSTYRCDSCSSDTIRIHKHDR